MELTQTISIAMAAMLAIVTATLTNSGLFKQRSAHQTVLARFQGYIPDDPLNQLLHSSHVTATMDTRAVRAPAELDDEGYHILLESQPEWCVIGREAEDLYLVKGNELLDWLKAATESAPSYDLTAADIRRWTIAAVPQQASLRQALDTMRNETSEAVCVYERSERTGKRLLQGVVTRESIEKFSLSGLHRE
jgi:CBS-domain-containing membrane protein